MASPTRAATVLLVLAAALVACRGEDEDPTVRQSLREATITNVSAVAVNLAEQRAIALLVDERWGFKTTIAANLATMATKAV